MSNHIVCLSFDFDAMSSWIANKRNTPTMLSRGEFGAVGALRILALLAKYQISTTWFIPGITIKTYPDICRQIVDHGHEIGHHGWRHIPPANLTREDENDQLEQGNQAIKDITGLYAKGYRSPSWDLSAHSVELLQSQGFLYDSSMMGDDYTPYYCRIGDTANEDSAFKFGKPSKLLELPISWSTDDFPHFEYIRTDNGIMPGLSSAKGVLENWLGDFRFMHENLERGILTYTFHPFCIGRGHRMLILEKLIKKLRKRGARFLTMADAAADFIAQSGN